MKKIVILGVLVILSYGKPLLTQYEVVAKNEAIKEARIASILSFQVKIKEVENKQILIEKLTKSDKNKLLNLMLWDRKALKKLAIPELNKINNDSIFMPIPSFGPYTPIPIPIGIKIPKVMNFDEIAYDRNLSKKTP